jgi:uncharacterized protein YbjT (DUF2867 family)
MVRNENTADLSADGPGATQRVLVAGATGYLGRFVARELASRGHRVRALARSPRKLDDLRDELDEIVCGEVTRPETLTGVCDGVDVVFSSVGVTRQKDGLTFKDVDYHGNKNLLQVAKQAGVKKFIYVSVLHGPELTHLDIVKAHEDFVAELAASGLDYTVVRPTGFFSDMGEVLEMARKGRVYLVGSGEKRVNPIHGADLAARCADLLDEKRQELEVGGPQILTWRQIAELALRTLNKPMKITSVPRWVLSTATWVTRLFNRHQAGLMAFFTTMATRDVVAPKAGTHTLEGQYRELAGQR